MVTKGRCIGALAAPELTPDGRLIVPHVLQLVRRGLELSADEMREIDGGWVVQTRRCRWSGASITFGSREPRSEAEIGQLVRLHLADTSYDHVVIEDDACARELENDFRTRMADRTRVADGPTSARAAP